MRIKKAGRLLALKVFLSSTMAWSGICYAASQLDCDPSKPEATPLGRFRIDDVIGTVFDTQTNLTWKRCTEGQILKTGTCTGEVKKWKWHDAVFQFGIDGKDWRLPSVDELYSIVEPRCKLPSINQEVFPDSPSHWVWSHSRDLGDSGNAWYVNFSDGSFETYSRYDSNPVRLVRGSQLHLSNDALNALKAKKVAQGLPIEEKNRIDEEKQQRELDARRKSAEEGRRQIEAIARARAELPALERSASISCPNKAACDKAFALTEIYFAKTADMKIQLATGTTIETHNPTEDGKIGLKAYKIPGKSASATISLTATCKATSYAYEEICVLGKLAAYRGFRPFIERMLKE